MNASTALVFLCLAVISASATVDNSRPVIGEIFVYLGETELTGKLEFGRKKMILTSEFANFFFGKMETKTRFSLKIFYFSPLFSCFHCPDLGNVDLLSTFSIEFASLQGTSRFF